MARQMKDSGVEWIGEIPETWDLVQLKRFVTVNNGREIEVEVDDTAEGAIGVYGSGGVFKYTDRYMHDGVAVMFGRKGTLGKPLYVDNKFWVVDTMYYLTYTEALHPKYNYYQLMVFDWNPHITQTALPSVVASQIVAKHFPIPDIKEQHRIADFLDRRCAEIDAVIERTKATIEEYKKLKQAVITEAVTKGVRGERKMKDSGIEWIGEIPEEWRLAKMHHVCAIITDYVASGSFASLAENVIYLDEPDYAMLVRTMDVSGKGYSGKPVYINQHAYEYLSNSNLFGGEIMLPNIGASVGDVYIVPKLYERMSLAPNSIMLRTNINDKFVYYYFMGNSGRRSVLDIAESTAQPKFNKTDFRQLRIPLPCDIEQDEIVDYLDEKCAALDTLIAKKTALLTELETYKKSLIYEYVTGKKEVQ